MKKIPYDGPSDRMMLNTAEYSPDSLWQEYTVRIEAFPNNIKIRTLHSTEKKDDF